jgi:hypothetical protein
VLQKRFDQNGDEIMCRWLAYQRDAILLDAFWFEVKLKGRQIVEAGDNRANAALKGTL